MSSKCIDFLYVIKSIIVNDCFVICVGLSLLSKTVDMTEMCVGRLMHASSFRDVVVWETFVKVDGMCDSCKNIRS